MEKIIEELYKNSLVVKRVPNPPKHLIMCFVLSWIRGLPNTIMYKVYFLSFNVCVLWLRCPSWSVFKKSKSNVIILYMSRIWTLNEQDVRIALLLYHVILKWLAIFVAMGTTWRWIPSTMYDHLYVFARTQLQRQKSMTKICESWLNREEFGFMITVHFVNKWIQIVLFLPKLIFIPVKRIADFKKRKKICILFGWFLSSLSKYVTWKNVARCIIPTYKNKMTFSCMLAWGMLWFELPYAKQTNKKGCMLLHNPEMLGHCFITLHVYLMLCYVKIWTSCLSSMYLVGDLLSC